MSDDLVISAEHVKKAYRSGTTVTPVLEGVEIQVQRGEIVFLAGPSGSGKSTLLSILGCVLSADAGRIQILGEDVTCFDAKQKAQFRRHRIGFVFQRFHLFRGLTAWENVRVPMDLLGRPAKQAKADCLGLLEAVGMADKATSPITKLSVGQCQRVALARALAADPDVILADEPTASLDAQRGHDAMRLIRNLAKMRGKTVVVVTHDSRVFSMADRVLHLENGRITRETSGAGTAASQTVQRGP